MGGAGNRERGKERGRRGRRKRGDYILLIFDLWSRTYSPLEHGKERERESEKERSGNPDVRASGITLDVRRD